MLIEQQFQNLGRYRKAFRGDPRVNELPGPGRGSFVFSSGRGDRFALVLESKNPEAVIQAVQQYLDANVR